MTDGDAEILNLIIAMDWWPFRVYKPAAPAVDYANTFGGKISIAVRKKA